MSRPETSDSGTGLDALLATPTPTPAPIPTAGPVDAGDPDEAGDTGQGQQRGDRFGRPARGRLEAWLRGGSDTRDELSDPPPRQSELESRAQVESDSDSAAQDEMAASGWPEAPVDAEVAVGAVTSVDGVGPAGAFRTVPVESIEPNSYQPRRQFDEDSLAALADSIQSLGVLQPVLVREVAPERYELVAGERRWRAAQRAGLRMIPALVRVVDDRAALEQAIVENLHRQDLNPLEEAAAYQELVDDFGLTQEQVSTTVGKSRSAVANTLRLLQLPGAVQRLVVDGLLSAGHARAVLTLPSEAAQKALAERIVGEELSVRRAEEVAKAWGSGDAGQGSDGSSDRAGRGKSIAALEVQMLLEERFETRVEVQQAGRGGRLVIRFADDDDLQRIVGLALDQPVD